MCVWLTTTQPLDEGNDILGRCVANAVRSPILYMVSLLLAGQVLGEVAGPYVNAVNEQFNRMLQELAMRPDVQKYGQWAAIAAGVVVAGSVLYDWCSNEAGEAFTAIGPKKSTSIDEVRVGGSSLGSDRVTTVVRPVTNTPGRDETGENAGDTSFRSSPRCRDAVVANTSPRAEASCGSVSPFDDSTGGRRDISRVTNPY